MHPRLSSWPISSSLLKLNGTTNYQNNRCRKEYSTSNSIDRHQFILELLKESKISILTIPKNKKNAK
jgi:hypothetical protein